MEWVVPNGSAWEVGAISYPFFWMKWVIYSMHGTGMLMETRSPPLLLPLCSSSVAMMTWRRRPFQAHDCKWAACLLQEMFNNAESLRLNPPSQCWPFWILSGSVCSCAKPSDTYHYKLPFPFKAVHHFHKWILPHTTDIFFIFLVKMKGGQFLIMQLCGVVICH